MSDGNASATTKNDNSVRMMDTIKFARPIAVIKKLHFLHNLRMGAISLTAK
jgi:hypothetical protein